ncbi:hypothetical protein FO519_007179 [Halicephalobus sp. NKZ332]|nr:hypothetical protein FO519_007179 [Halicephalobus sp. NKZ332]
MSGMQQGHIVIQRPMNQHQRYIVDQGNVMEYISKLPEQYQHAINQLSLDEKIQKTQAYLDKMMPGNIQDQQRMGQRIHMQQRMTTGNFPAPGQPPPGNMSFGGQPPMQPPQQQNFIQKGEPGFPPQGSYRPIKAEQGFPPQNFQKIEPGFQPQHQQGIQPKQEPGFPQQPGFPAPQIAPQQAPEPLLQPPQPSQGPGSHQPPSQQQIPQGSSPAVANTVLASGRVPTPTPSTRSNQSTNTVPPEIFNSPEYQEVFKEICSNYDLVIKIRDRMKLDGDQRVGGFNRIISIIEGKMQVQKELLAKLIKNIHSVANKYDPTTGLNLAASHLQKTPAVNLTKVIDNPDAKFADKMIRAPKELYNLADGERRVRKQRMFLRKRIKWVVDHGIDDSEPLKHPCPTIPVQFTKERLTELRDRMDELDEEETVEKGNGKKVHFHDFASNVDEDGFIECIVRVEGDPPMKKVARPDFYDNADDPVPPETQKEEDENLGPIEENEITAEMYYKQGVYNCTAPPEDQPMLFLGEDSLLDDNLSQKREIGSDEGPSAKRIKLEERSEKSDEKEVPRPGQYFAFPSGRAQAALTKGNTVMNEAYTSFLKRKQEENFDGPVSMNAKHVQNDEFTSTAAMPIENPTNNPVMDSESPHLEEIAEDCPFNCCVPYYIDALIGKTAKLPQPAATELRRFRHRADFEFLPLSEHTQVFSVIINPSKYGSYRYPEIRIFIHRDYPNKPADYHIILPSTIRSKAVKSFYKKLEEKMEDRRLSGVPLKTITEIVSAFRVACDMIYRNKDMTGRVPLRLLYHFDLLCPHSYLEGFVYDGVSVVKRKYIARELDLIAELYDLKKPNKFYWGQELLKKRSASALLLLVQLKRENPEYFKRFLETFFDEIWLRDEKINKVAKFFRVGRELGIEFRIMDEIISRVEFPENIRTLLERTRKLTLADALGTPWIEFGTESHCFVTNEIMRLEMIDHFLENPEHIPERRPILEGREFQYVSDKTPCTSKMSKMYRLPPFVQEDIAPTEIMYKLPSYHIDAKAANTSTSTSTSAISDLADLLRESVKLTTDLAQDILNYVNQHSAASSSDSKQKPQAQAQEKKEKNPKKQKNQEVEAEAATHFRGNVTFHFKFQNYKKLDGKLEITCDKTYGELVSFLRDLAVKRGVGQNVVVNQAGDHKIKAVLTTSDGKKNDYDGFAPVLAVLGEVTGLYSQQDQSLRQTSHWLTLADEVITKKTPVDSVVREMSRHLGPFDLLNKTASITLADVVLFNLVKSMAFLPNNVEISQNKMPFMRGAMPLRRTLFYLNQGKVVLRDDVSVLVVGYHGRPQPEQQGTRDFVFWHWAQLQYKNPHLQLVKKKDFVITPFAMAILKDGREVLFDFEGKSKEEVEDTLQTTLGKTPLVRRREFLERMQDHNPAEFGVTCKRQCLCEVQGQQPCTSLLLAPKYVKGKFRWNHNLL